MDTNDVVAEVGDVMGANMIAKGSPNRFFREFSKERGLRVRVLALRERVRRRTSACRKMQRNHDM